MSSYVNKSPNENGDDNPFEVFAVFSLKQATVGLFLILSSSQSLAISAKPFDDTDAG
jgi:hypothetical protein